MATADKDGRIARMVGDMHACLGMSLHENAREMRVAVTKALVEAAPDGDDGPCHACGQSYPVWRAPDDLWNLVLGGSSAKGDPGGMLCPNCFLRLADLVEPQRGAWVLSRATSVEPGPCWHASTYTGPGDTEFRCELRAGHLGAHECDRGSWGGNAVWTEADVREDPR